ncbi:hypothetical protein IF2G_10378 [Cordyceps javanica]|nr:hypothetical protein IF2G_10378 [Cordyceps javanica]
MKQSLALDNLAWDKVNGDSEQASIQLRAQVVVDFQFASQKRSDALAVGREAMQRDSFNQLSGPACFNMCMLQCYLTVVEIV